MKKFLVLFVALLLALPAISYAGSVTSRWDVTIGGFVKADFGYADQGVGADGFIANRRARDGFENVYDEYGNYFNAAGEGRLNFLIKGPETWGAKSSAFVEGDFRGGWGAAASYGLFQLRHAFLKFDWTKDTLIIGQTWQAWGLMPCFCVLNVNELGPFNKGGRVPQITWTHGFTKQLSTTVSMSSPYGALGSTVGQNTVNRWSKYPQLAGEVNYKTDAMGKIGPWMLQFGVGGFIGREKLPYADDGTTELPITSFTPGGNQQTAAHWRDEERTIWGLSFKGFVPIICERKPDQKAGALGFGYAIFTGQGHNAYQGPLQVVSYLRGTGESRDLATPTFWGGWGQLFFYLTNTVSTNVQYGQVKYNASQSYRAANVNTVKDVRHYIWNIIWDPNPAVRVGAQLSRVYTQYMAPTATLRDNGAFNEVRIAAYYFF
jgi:hypothetical protein